MSHVRIITRRARAGSALLELLVALPLALLICAVAVQLFSTQLRVTARTESRMRNQRELSHAAMVLAADLRAASVSALEAWSDTSIVVFAPVMIGVVCATPAPHVIDVVAGDHDHVLREMASAAPRAGDRAYIAPADSSLAGAPPTALDSASIERTLRNAQSTALACTSSPLRAGSSRAPWRLELVAPPPLPPDIGTLVTVARRTEWRAYRASDGEHYLGRRDWNGSAWSTTQPVAGPLANSAQRGFRLRVTRSDGTPVGVGDPTARIIAAHLRMHRRPAHAMGTFDSLSVQLALRGGK